MTTQILLTCDGCRTETKTESVRRSFKSVTGKSYGLGAFHYPSIGEAVEPTGWVWSDPYTGCTYCPKCWAEIDAE